MSIRFLSVAKQEPSSIDKPDREPQNPWIRLDSIKTENSEFSECTTELRDNSMIPLFQRPTKSQYIRPPAPIHSFEDAIEAIRNGRLPVVEQQPKLLQNVPYSRINSSLCSRDSTLERLGQSLSPLSSSYSDHPSRSPSIELGSGKKYSLAGLSHNEVKERKKEQNILAARRYRQRRTDVLNQRKEEIEKLEVRRAELMLQEASLAGQINALKELFAENLKQRTNGAAAFGLKKTDVEKSASCNAIKEEDPRELSQIEAECL